MKLKIISDGTNVGTKLIDEETGQMVHGISKLTWEADANEILTKVSVEFFNIPVEIVSKADVELYELLPPDWTQLHTKSFEKTIKITSKDQNKKAVASQHVNVYDSETEQAVGAIQNIKWEATPEGCKAKVKKFKFDKKDW